VSIAFGAWALTVGLLLIQPDIGQTLLITTTFMAVFFMAGVPLKWVAALAAAGAAGVVGLYFAFSHMRDRLSRFLSPETTDTHQIDRASEAIRAGGLVGRGVGEGVMKRSVPDLHTDFIYSVGAEEFGLVLSLAMIALYAFIVVRGMRRAMKLTDPFEQTAAAGLFMLIGLQACINIAVNLNLIPTKGMTLPFISYGGSSMLAMGLTMGLALALTRRRPGAYEPGTTLPDRGRILP
jgi:cell division protein FtsW